MSRLRTPYCAAIGLRRREVDEIRISIGIEVSRLTQVECRNAEVDADLDRERGVAAGALNIPVTAYFARMQAERRRLEEERQAINGRVARLRSQAREAYGSLNAIEGAAQRYRDEALHKIESAEQAATDDRSAADFVARARLIRTASAKRSP
ncbi:MAG TPA: hypothetical protein VE567_04215 [Sphingomonas sp.]|nr:hypothetical protein [Sphingomonas sp.]